MKINKNKFYSFAKVNISESAKNYVLKSKNLKKVRFRSFKI